MSRHPNPKAVSQFQNTFAAHSAIQCTMFRLLAFTSVIDPETLFVVHTYPFRAPWKKKRTINTCSPAIVTIRAPSIRLKLKILRSVLLTVLKFLFSLVRKYF